jgi:hypothetical protein
MARPITQYSYNYEDIKKLTDLSRNMIHQYVTRGDLDPYNLESLVLFLARHGKDDLKLRMIRYAASWGLTEKASRRPKGTRNRQRGNRPEEGRPRGS